MKIEFYGAIREVTGSKFIIEARENRILVECGLFQGRRKKTEEKNRNIPFDVNEIDFMILSHAHIDHSGNIPGLVKKGFSSDIYATSATVDLLKHMLLDSAHIQERDAEYFNNKIRKKDEEPVKPLYTVEDAEKSLNLFTPLFYHVYENRGVSFHFLDAGHILGSAELVVNAEKKNILFTGDLGRSNLPIIRDPEIPDDIDILIMESTYGNRMHREISDVEEDLVRIINDTVDKKGKIIVPSFAVERAQEVIYIVNSLIIEGKIPEIPIYVDSPLTVNVTGVFMKHPEYFDHEAYELLKENDVFHHGKINYIRGVEESKELNQKDGPMLIISASGMCEHGRILHHLKNNIEDERNVILIVGFQAENTLGRKLVEGKKEVNIFGEPYERKAPVVVMNEFSAHADRRDLINFAKKVDPERIFLVHGEEDQIDPLGETLKGLGYSVDIPSVMGERYEI